jgi:hypothetical protein
MQADINCSYLLSTHVNAVSKKYYSHVRMRIAVLGK